MVTSVNFAFLTKLTELTKVTGRKNG